MEPGKEQKDIIPPIVIGSTQGESLWPRFTRVMQLLQHALTDRQPSPETQRHISSFHWEGEDAGIHDHTGTVITGKNGLRLNLTFKGTIIDAQSRVVQHPDGQWGVKTFREQYVDMTGKFTSKDGRQGMVRLISECGRTLTAFWLQVANGAMRLEQIIDATGKVHNAEDLDVGKPEIQVPGTNTRFTRFIK